METCGCYWNGFKVTCPTHCDDCEPGKPCHRHDPDYSPEYDSEGFVS